MIGQKGLMHALYLDLLYIGLPQARSSGTVHPRIMDKGGGEVGEILPLPLLRHVFSQA